MTTDRETIVAAFRDRVETDPSRVALHKRRGDAWVSQTWAELARDVYGTAAALTRAGVEPGDRVILVAPNRYEWIVCDLAIQFARAVHVPVHNALAGPQITYQIRDSGAKVAILAGASQAEKLADQTANLPDGLQFFALDECPGTIGRFSVRSLADATAAVTEDEAKQAMQAADVVQPNDLATILYTSGTTGEPKGVMLSQRNLASNALASIEAFTTRADDLRLSWLPWSHIFARTCDLYTWICAGHELAIAESPEQVIAHCGQIHPTLLNGVPYFFEKVQRYLTDQKLADTPGSLARVLGGRMRAMCAGGAPLPEHTAKFYDKQGVLVLEGYGMTESSPVIATCTEKARKIGTVGPPIPGVEVRISAEGEILTRGPHVMLGYWNRPDATAETIVDDWLYTGDLGEIDSDGYVKITGRKKELIVTSAGKNIAPTYLEAMLTADPLILQVLVIGDRRSYLTALIVPNPDNLRAEIIQRRIPVTSAAQALVHPDVLQLYRQHIDDRLAGVSRYEQVGKFTLLDRGFTVEGGQLTPTLKLRRQVIQTEFAALIEAMYSGAIPGCNDV
jgi:long-chain acyl-CoA synthetase